MIHSEMIQRMTFREFQMRCLVWKLELSKEARSDQSPEDMMRELDRAAGRGF